MKWLSDNQEKLNTEMSCFLKSQGHNTIKIGNLCINNSSCDKLLRINFDYQLKFTNHIEEIC